jgi:hypothetical protein
MRTGVIIKMHAPAGSDVTQGGKDTRIASCGRNNLRSSHEFQEERLRREYQSPSALAFLYIYQPKKARTSEHLLRYKSTIAQVLNKNPRWQH